MKLIQLLLLAFVTCTLFACNQAGCSENQDNSILSSNPPESSEYQRELIRLINSESDEVDYYFEARQEIDSDNALAITCYGSDFCGTVFAMVYSEDEHSKKLQNKKGWRGAKLKGLELLAVDVGANKRMVYQKMDEIVD